ncbi:MAG: hypothetical protein R3C56_41085, partial [Pirellulaceae bacterium]
RNQAKCCRDAQNTGLVPPNAVGKLICCDGQKVACVFRDRLPENEKAGFLIARCVQMHEKVHLNHYECPNRCPHMSAGNYQPGMNNDISECIARKRTDECLREAFSICRRNGFCDANEVSKMIVDIWIWGRAFCGKRGNHYFNGPPF